MNEPVATKSASADHPPNHPLAEIEKHRPRQPSTENVAYFMADADTLV